MKIQFLGAAKTVTGSKYLVTADKQKILVDCGLFQGYKELRQRNWSRLPVDPQTINAVILTHAHLDHSGYIPLLVKNGFRGKILCTKGTYDLATILLPDSGYLQEEEASYANKKGYSSHKPALPLYTKDDAEQSLKYFQTVDFAKSTDLGNGLHFTLYPAGHILGASMVWLADQDTSILFSGDLGRPNDPIMRAPAPPPKSDYMVLESTYGNRVHEERDPADILAEVINRTINRGGSVLIPAFAVGRAQIILYYLHQLQVQNKIPKVDIYIDSPMAVDVTKIFCTHTSLHRLTDQQASEVCASAKYIRSSEESYNLSQDKTPKIIISASGMATGGRVLHHLKVIAPDARNTLLFAGYQAGGTRGDSMIKGKKEIKIHGEDVTIAAEVCQISNLSAHADANEIIAWLAQASLHLKRFLSLMVKGLQPRH